MKQFTTITDSLDGDASKATKCMKDKPSSKSFNVN